jgi:queuosine precursor transporter
MFKLHVTYLIGLYVACEVIANISAGKITQFGPFSVPAAIYIFALTFTLIDLINEALGKQGARRVVIAGVAANCVLALYSLLVLALPAAPWFKAAQSFHDVLGMTPRIVAASLLAALISGLLDVELFAALRKRVNAGWRVVGSNALSTLVDSVLFITLAFAGSPVVHAGSLGLELKALGLLILGQYIVKMLVTAVSVPLIYAVKAVTKVSEAERAEADA